MYACARARTHTNTHDTRQWAAWDGIRKFEAEKHDYLQGQIGNPEGADKPNKKVAYVCVCMRLRVCVSACFYVVSEYTVCVCKHLGCVHTHTRAHTHTHMHTRWCGQTQPEAEFMYVIYYHVHVHVCQSYCTYVPYSIQD